MKPVSKGLKMGPFSQYGQAKPSLVERIGEFCSYCESASGKIQNLQVEHIYSQEAHPRLSLNWSNFLLACSSCNTYKRHHLGDDPLHDLKHRSYWPQLDNTFSALEYHPDGRVAARPGAGPRAQELIDMAGLLGNPAVAEAYAALELAYTGVQLREEAWAIAETARVVYHENPSINQEQSIINTAVKTGFFSIWMHVFENVIRMRLLFIEAFRADPACFDGGTSAPIQKGRI